MIDLISAKTYPECNAPNATLRAVPISNFEGKALEHNKMFRKVNGSVKSFRKSIEYNKIFRKVNGSLKFHEVMIVCPVDL